VEEAPVVDYAGVEDVIAFPGRSRIGEEDRVWEGTVEFHGTFDFRLLINADRMEDMEAALV
jgi:hypothetical protein